MNNVFIIGRLTSDPSITETKEHKKARITLAVDGYNGHTNFIPVTTFDARADMFEKYLIKGMRIAVTGELYQYEYEKDGQKRYAIEISASHIDFCDSKRVSEEVEEEEEEEEDPPKKKTYRKTYKK